MINLTKMLELTIASRNDLTKSIELETLIKQYIAEETAKAKGGNKEKQRLTAARKYLKNSKKKNGHQPALHGTWFIEDKQYICDAHSGIELVSTIEGLPELPKNIEPLKLIDIIKMTEEGSRIKVDMPAITELKAQFKQATAEAKAKNVKTSEIKAGLIKMGKSIIDLKILLDTIALFPTDTLEYFASDKRTNIIIKDKLGNRAIICPLLMTVEKYDSLGNESNNEVV